MDEEEFLAYAARLRGEGAHLAADLFSGAGGLSLGLEAAGYRVVLSADHDVEAVETHRHHFGGLALDWDLSDPGHVAQIARLVSDAGVELLAGGPPCQPFSKAGRSKIRHRIRHGLRDPSDERRDLWRSFLEVVRLAQPAGRGDGERPGHGAGPGDVHPADDGARAGDPRLRGRGTRRRHLALRRSPVPAAADPRRPARPCGVPLAGRDTGQDHRVERHR